MKGPILTIAAASLFAASASATELNLEGYVGVIVERAVETTIEEMSFGIEEAVLTAGHLFSLDESAEPNGKVAIHDMDTNAQSESTGGE